MTIVVCTDGGSRGNPGLSAAAFYIPSFDVKVGIPLPDCTNNVAEYKGVIEALKYVHETFGPSEVEIRSDSKLIVEQLKRVYQVKSESLLNYWAEASAWADQHVSVLYTHVPRAENKVSDEIANMTMDRMLSHGVKEPIYWKTL